METSKYSKHIAGIIPVAGAPLDLNMPWHDSLMPIHDDYHAVERAVHTAAAAGCSTIWIVLDRAAQPFIKKKLGEWIYDPAHIWEKPYPFFNKREIPIYYVSIRLKDKNRKDSQAWSCLYGAKVASYISMKISHWVVPKRFLVVSPYGVVSEETIKANRLIIGGTQNVAFTYNNQTFLDNTHLPFTFQQEEYESCRKLFSERYSGNDIEKRFSDIFKPVDLSTYNKINLEWHYDISNWQGYSQFIGSEHNKLCERPKYMVTHKWRGFMKDK
jgi:hypothetical protein